MKKRVFTWLFAMAALATSANEFYLTKVFDFLPAPGQFVNVMPKCDASMSRADVLKAVEAEICGVNDDGDLLYTPGMISLGAFGGYVVVGFDHPVVNVKGDYDFQIFGNAFTGASEPGIVMVSYDANGNGEPDDAWYELAGSDYHAAKTQHHYTITYQRPANELGEVSWTSNDAVADSTAGTVKRNVFHGQSYWPLWVTDSEITFTGTKLCNNSHLNGSTYVLEARDWGYVDDRKDYDPYSSAADDQSKNHGFKIDWAVDADGTPVTLPMVHFIKIYSATNQDCGMIGETSTEVRGGIDFHPDAVATSRPGDGDVNGDNETNTSDTSMLVNFIIGAKNAGYNPVGMDVNTDGEVNTSDVSAVVNVVLGN